MKKNILLLVLVLVTSYFTAPYVGGVYDKFYPQYGDWIIGKNDSIFFAGFLLSYIALIPFVFGLFGVRGNKSILWFLLPVLLFLLFADSYHVYIPITFGLTGFALAKFLRLIISKLHHPNPPMVIK